MSDPLEGIERGQSVPSRAPSRPARTRPTMPRRQVCPECGELAAIPSDHLPNCSLSVAIVGVWMAKEPALLDATGATPIKLMLHADGSVSWRPLYGKEPK